MQILQATAKTSYMWECNYRKRRVKTEK